MEEEQSAETVEVAQETQAPAPAEQPAAKDSGPPPVPYSVFSKTNADLRAAEKRLAEYEKQLQEFGPTKVQALQSEIESVRQGADLRLGLVKAGAQDQYLDYLATRYQSLEGEKPPANEWAASLKDAEPAFFGTASASAVATATATAPVAAPVAAQPTTPPPTTSPETTVSSPANNSSQPRPLSEAVIKQMTQAEFADRWDEIVAWRYGQSRAKSQ